MPPPAKYPRAAVRKIVKAHSQKRVSRNVDALVYLDYVLFIEEYV
jgi:histone H3/H4